MLGVGAALAVSEHLTVRYADAATSAGTDVLVVMFLRGGFDGLSAVVPVGDPDYYKARPSIAVPQASTIALDSRFGLHPSLSALKPFWDNGTFGVVHAAGMTSPNRSHFSAMEEIERAAAGLERPHRLAGPHARPAPAAGRAGTVPGHHDRRPLARARWPGRTPR